MTLWMAWSLLISSMLAAAAAVLERAASYLGAPRRFVWIAALLAATGVPGALATRRAPAPLSFGGAMATAGAMPSVALSAQPRTETLASVTQSSRAFADWTSIAHRADRWLVMAWLSASSVLSMLFLRQLVWLRRRQSGWESVDTDMGVVLVAQNIGPAVVGFFRPRIVVPSWTLSADRTTRELLHRHELEHIRAGDMRALLASELVLILVPWNAALWWMTRRLRLAIELDCDARVVRAVGGAHAYGSVLLSVGERHAAGAPLTTSFSGSQLNLEVRINAMTAPNKRHAVASALPLAATALGVLATAAWVPRPVPLVPARANRGSDLAPSTAATPTPRIPEAPHASGGEPLTPAPIVVAAPISAQSLSSNESAPVGNRQRPSNREPPVGQEQPGQEPRVTLNLANAPITNVLDVFAKFSHRTIIASKDVSGAVTGVIQDQPWRSALRSLLNPSGYDFAVSADSSLFVDTIDAIRRLGRVRDTTLAGVGYAARKQAGAGFFIDGNQIDPRANAFSELIRAVPGFRVASSADGRAYVISDAQTSVDGCVNVFVDGVLWQTVTPGDIDSAIRPAQVVAVEAYKSASTPPQFAPQNQNRCATIVVWTRARVRPD